jgi:hypothetical protein
VASWVLVPCLVKLRTEFNILSPGRDRESDGSIGDEAHAGSSSDHNPDETGSTPSEDADSINEVHAIDVDRDLRRSGWTMDRALKIIIERHRSGRDDRLQNVIYNRRIWSRSWGWTAREYTGSNPHDKHAHFSARYTTPQESSTMPWGLLEEDDLPLTNADADIILGRDNVPNPYADSATNPRITVATALKAAAQADATSRDILAVVARLQSEVTRLSDTLTRVEGRLSDIEQKLGATTVSYPEA